ncbi:MAG: radical SAM family heme chaperone HemW [Clostridia bacterium]|nr:radical SAM family heme chaperone HemW [Clostridia bacterium]
MEKKLGLYIHIPFCEHKCDYCDFYSVTKFNDYVRYTDALLLQMEDFSEKASDYIVNTIYIGGGTPTVLPVKRMLEIIDGIYRNFNVAENVEFTMEANPATVNKKTLKNYIAGVNRLSFGMQSAIDEELAALSRIHTFEEFVNSYNMAKKAGFENINVDIMYGIPGQTQRSLGYTLEQVCDLEPTHISLYGLKIEEGTPFFEKKDKLELPDEDTEYDMYKYSVDYLRFRGYWQYEISNFSKDGFKCKHNLKYWNCQEYLGLGPAAHSYFSDRRFSYKRSVPMFMDALEYVDAGINILEEDYAITPEERVDEYIMLKLRLTEGINVNEFKYSFNKDFSQMFEKELKLYIDNGFMEFKNGHYYFTTKGMYVSNYILSTFMTYESDITRNIAKGLDK